MLSMALWLALDDLMAQLDDLCHSYLYFCVDHPSTNKYQKYKSVELGDQLGWHMLIIGMCLFLSMKVVQMLNSIWIYDAHP